MIHNMATTDFTNNGVVVVVRFEFMAVVHEALVTEFAARCGADNWFAGFFANDRQFIRFYCCH
jgi:hypothetical protein